MKKIHILTLFSFFLSYSHDNTIELTIASTHRTRTPIALLSDNLLDNSSEQVIRTIKNDLIFSDQFSPRILASQKNMSKKELAEAITKVSSEDIPFALHLCKEEKNVIKWRLYDTFQGTMICGKKYTPKADTPRIWGHAIADEIVSALTGNKGFFSSRITYCKEIKDPADTSKTIKHIYIADFDGNNEELLVDTQTINVAPRWSNNIYQPSINYSEYTDTNVQLMSVGMDKHKKITSNLDGVNMLVDFSPDGQKSVFCSSKGKGNCQIMCQTKTSLSNLTQNTGNNVSPIFIDNQHICFCSDFQTKSPQLFIGNLETGHIQRITKGGYCSSPHHCAHNNKITYSMKVNNVMQVYSYDCELKEHTQMTFSAKNKFDPCWSPDGTHLLWSEELNGKQHLSSLNVLTNTVHRITALNDNCSYPHWSPCYKVFPTTKGQQRIT